MSRVNVWWPIYPADEAIDTQGLTLEEIGAYVILRNQYWRTQGELCGSNAYLARMLSVSPQKWKRLRPVMERFFTVDGNGKWHHARLDAELSKARADRHKKQQAARARWSTSDADAMQVHSETDANGYAGASAESMQVQCPSPSPSPSPFSTHTPDPDSTDREKRINGGGE